MRSRAAIAITLFAVAASMVTSQAFGQTKVITTKPIASTWLPTDFASHEIQLIGRKGTDATTAHKIIGRIILKSLDFTLLTQRVTILVPANEIWEIKALAFKPTPLNSTGLKAFTEETNDFLTSFFPTPGQVLAIDVNVNTGDIFMGPVGVIVPIPAPAPVPVPGIASPPGATAPPLTQLVDATGAVFTIIPPKVFRNGADTNIEATGYSDVDYIYISAAGGLRANSPSHGYTCWSGAAWGC
jgi:hypothetical protein